MGLIYVTGHRNPDTDSIASAIGYAELMGRLDTRNEYAPVRLGEVNAQTRWVLERAETPEPELLEHVRLRVLDVMRTTVPQAAHGDPVRDVGRTMARENLDLLPIVGDAGELVGVVSERALARRYIRESRETSRLDAPDGRARDRRRARGRPAGGRSRARGQRARVGAGDGHGVAADRLRAG